MQVVKILRELGNFEFAIKAIYVVILGLIGTLMFFESLNAMRKMKASSSTADTSVAVASRFNVIFQRLPLQVNFTRCGIRTSSIFPFLIGAFVGFLVAIMGVGGGFIMVPTMIYIIGMPTIIAIGTDLFKIVLTTANVTLQQAMTNHTVDVVLAVTLFCGSALGAQIGALASRKLRGAQIRILLAIIVLLLMVKLLFDLILTPDNVIGFVKGGGGH